MLEYSLEEAAELLERNHVNALRNVETVRRPPLAAAAPLFLRAWSLNFSCFALSD
jgi:hypothetical protein